MSFETCRYCTSPVACRTRDQCNRQETPKAVMGGGSHMKLAIPMTCLQGHRYYRESGTQTECPYCLQRNLTLLQAQWRRAKSTVIELFGS